MRPATQLYLTFEVAGDSAAALSVLTAALAAAKVDCVLVRDASGASLDPTVAEPLVRTIQKRDIAALIADDAALARMLKADGVHLGWSKAPREAYGAARELLGDRALIGIDAGRSRHDAMELGEGGADYVAFGIPGHVEDRASAEARQVDLVRWWGEIFEVPVVAFDVESSTAAAALAAAGADFVTVSISSEMTGDEAAVRVRDTVEAVARPGVAA